MNIVVLPLVVMVILLSILGVYSTSTNSEYDIAKTSMDSMVQASERRNEIIHAVIDEQVLTVANHGMQQSKILLMDFRMDNGTVSRVTFSNDAFFDRYTPTKEIHRNPDMAPTISAGAEMEIGLRELDINYLDVSSASITSENGNRFLVDVSGVSRGNSSSGITPANATATATDPAGQGQAMIDGMGLQARIIQIDFEDDTAITFGRGVAGDVVSLKPYIAVNQDTDFAALVKNTDNPEVYAIPEFWRQYSLGSNGVLTDMTAEAANVLGYTSYRVLSGNVDVSVSSSGGGGGGSSGNNGNNNSITVTGSGRAILQLNDYQGQKLILRGSTSSGIAKMITSDVSLSTAPYYTRGFLTYSAGIDPAPDSFRVPAGLDSTHTGIFEYDQIYLKRHQHHCKCAIHIHPNEVNHVATHASLVKRDSINYMTITGDNTAPADISPTYSITPLGTENFSFKLYDTLPSYQHAVLQNAFETEYTFPQGVSYLYVEPNGSTITLKAEQHTDTPFLKIVNVTPDMPYRIIKDGHTIAAGMSDHTGQILVEEHNDATTLAGGMLHLYRDALTYRGHLDTLVFDEMHQRIIHLGTPKSEIYTVHMYARIPVTGTVNITDTSLDNTQDIPYIDGHYRGEDDLSIPVLPGFDTIHMRINGIQTSLRYADILGSTGITIAEPKTSQITQSSVSSPIRYAESAAGTVAFAIATSDGRLKAVISETISGSIRITNTYKLQAVPPPPSAILRDDPLTGEVDIFVNGLLREQITLGVNPYPDFAFTSVRQGSDVVQSVRYSYPQYTLAGTASIDVRTGDLVEFYVYSKIHGAISRYVPPEGHVVVQSYGTSEAIAVIQSAHINTDM